MSVFFIFFFEKFFVLERLLHISAKNSKTILEYVYGGVQLQYEKSECVYRGRACGKENDIVIGRLRVARGEIGRCRESSVLYFGSQMSLCRVLPRIDQYGQIGAIVCCEGVHEEIGSVLAAKGLPFFLLDEQGAIAPESDGRIALIDFSLGRLIIDPKLDTLDRYSNRRGMKLLSRPSVKESAAVDPRTLSDLDLYRFRTDRGLLCGAEDIEYRGDFFELALALAEGSSQGGLCIGLPTAILENDEVFCERADAIFRAAVYGELSVMLEGYLSLEDIERSFRLMNKSYCRLEGEGREINGYLARGVMIETPLQLWNTKSLPRLDFLCFDFDALCKNLLGERVALDARGQSALCEFWSEYRYSGQMQEKTALRAKSSALFENKFFFEWVDFMGVDEIYLPYGRSPQKTLDNG